LICVRSASPCSTDFEHQETLAVRGHLVESTCHREGNERPGLG
jgi:hypothetical protein